MLDAYDSPNGDESLRVQHVVECRRFVVDVNGANGG